jgi:Flp pilus assembly pilin Flp
MNHNAKSMFTSRAKQAGQGMTEYIIIVALIAVAAIAVTQLFGGTVRNQIGTMTGAVAGTSTTTSAAAAKTAGAQGTTAATKKGDLATYQSGGK